MKGVALRKTFGVSLLKFFEVDLSHLQESWALIPLEKLASVWGVFFVNNTYFGTMKGMLNVLGKRVLNEATRTLGEATGGPWRICQIFFLLSGIETKQPTFRICPFSFFQFGEWILPKPKSAIKERGLRHIHNLATARYFKLIRNKFKTSRWSNQELTWDQSTNPHAIHQFLPVTFFVPPGFRWCCLHNCRLQS